jgi:serine phosphatase RsbU (regulator of sigma subunit)
MVTKKDTSRPFAYLKKALRGLMEQPHVISYTLYLRDPITGDLRLFSCEGIKHPETIIGFILTSEQEQRRKKCNESGLEPPPEKYFKSAHEAPLVGRDPLPAAIRERIRHIAQSKKYGIYRTFVEREGIVSCFRIEQSKEEGRKQHTAILFVNFDAQVDCHRDSLSNALNLASDALEQLIFERFDHDYPTALRRTVRILQPIQHLVSTGEPASAVDFFPRLLAAVVEAMDIGEKEGFGTIHLFNATTGALELCACTNDWKPPVKKTLSAFEGEGVVAWVALNRKPVLIGKVSESAFRRLRVNHDEFRDVQSQLAVPMVVGDEVVGVLNIERRTANAFTPQDAHTLWYAATEAAVAYEFYNNAQRAQLSERRAAELLETANRAVNLGTRDDALLNELASLLQRWIKPAFVEIWEFDDTKNEFCYAGASYPHFKRGELPRPDGASIFVLKHQRAVWMGQIQGDGTYDPEFWDSENNCWTAVGPQPFPDGFKLPSMVNSVVVAERTTAELGIPIRAFGRCIGVAWLKYNTAEVVKPSAEEMELIIKLLGHVAIVVDAMRQLADREEKDLRDRVAKQYFDVGDLQKPGMRGHVLYEQRHSKVGGDFCVFLPGGERSWACLLGDVMGHGFEAALRMIPLINTFRISHRESASPSYALQQLGKLNENEIFATALCFAYFEQEVVSNGEDRRHIQRFVKACSAGHPPLIVIHRDGDYVELPTRNGPAKTQPLGAGTLMDFAEDCIPVFPGDLLIGYTDGVDEAGKKVRSALFGANRIKAIAIVNQSESPEVIAQKICEEARAYSQQEFADDVTILVVQICDDTEESPSP